MSNMNPEKLHIYFGDLTLGVAAADTHYLFSFQQGGLESLKKNGREWIYRSPRPTFWRALTENDHGSHFEWKSGMWLAADMYPRHIATAVFRDGKQIELPLPPANNIYTNDETADSFAVRFTYETLTAPKTTVDVTYEVVPDGEMTVTCAYHGQKGLPQFPVFGLRFIIPTAADGFVYEGVSGETYPDRMKGAVPGTYSVKGLPVTPYLVPQECGMHMETKHLEITRSTVLDNAIHDRTPFSLRFAAKEKPFAFNCLPYTAEELENALHQEELPPVHRTVLCVCGAVRGVGGIDTWGSDVEPAYHLDAEKDCTFSFIVNAKD